MTEKFGDRLRRLRLEAGYRAVPDLARAARLTKAYVYRLEAGAAPYRHMEVRTLERIAAALGTTPAALLYGEQEGE